jgi:hypothetical protein
VSRALVTEHINVKRLKRIGSVRRQYKQENLIVVTILNKTYSYVGSIAVKE